MKDEISRLEEKINNNSLKIKNNSYALEILKDYKIDKKRLFKLLVISICLWLVTLGYLIYVLSK